MAENKVTTGEDTIQHFASHTLKTYYENLSGEDILYTKKALLDYIGVSALGARERYCKVVVDQIRLWGGTPEATILFFNHKTNAPFAALANGMLARAVDLDDVYEDGFLQTYAHIISPLLVAAEVKGGCTGKDFITAFTIGTDINCRMAIANDEPCTVSGRYNLFRIFGAVAAVAKLWGLSESELRNALGISYGMIHGELQGLRDGAFSCLLSSGGFNAHNTMIACTLAKRGIPGTKNVLDGFYGFYRSFEKCSDKNTLLNNLGREFYGKRSSLKNYPSSRATHAGIDAALYLVKKHNIDVNKINKISIRMFDFCYGIVGSPIEKKRHPQNLEEAKFSYPFCVACALARGSVFPELLDESVLKDPLILSLAKKTDTIADKELGKFQALLSIEMSEGKVLSKRIDHCFGHPENPMGFEDVAEKFAKCIGYYLGCSHQNIPKVAHIVIDRISRLEDVKDINSIFSLINKELICR